MFKNKKIGIRINFPKYDFSKLNLLLNNKFTFYVGLLFLCVLLTFTYSNISKASTTLSPHVCLGGWKNTQNATGMVDVTDGDSHKYSDDNSASLSGSIADVFCGDFSGDIPKNTKPKAITVVFSWAMVPLSEAKSVSVTVENIASSTNSILDASPQTVGVSENVDVLRNITPVVPTFPFDSEKIETPTPTPDIVAPHPAPEAPPAVVEPGSPQSFLYKKLLSVFTVKNVYAEDVVENNNMDTSIDLNLSTTTESSATTTPNVLVEDPVLEISYTLDGEKWNLLGNVTRSNFSASSFVIPVDMVPEWTDLARLQIRVRALSSINNTGIIYLDGMSLVVDYEKSSKELMEQKKVEDSQEFMSTLPEKPLSLSPVVNSGALYAYPVDFADGKKGIRFADKEGGNIMVFKGTEHLFFINSGLGVDPSDMPLYLFPPDTYTVLDIGNSADCDQTKTIDDCRATESYKGESVFSVSLDSSVPVTSNDNQINQQ
jgi:hypothetical protein